MATPDPRLVAAIRAHRDPFDPLLLATALVESGGRLRAVGDNGNSHGPYQENRYGRGSGLSPEQSYDPVGSTARATREFQTFYNRGFRGPELAYRAQRPADRASYIAKIRQYLPVAQRILGMAGSGGASVPPAGAAPTAAATTPAAAPALSSRVFNAIQQYVQQSERDVLDGRMPGDVLPIIRMIQKETRARGTGPAAQTPSAPVAAGAAGSSAVQAGRFTSPWGGVSAPIIGRPGAGTHTLGNWQSDNAIDVRLPVGTPLYAPSDGTVGPQVGLLGSQNGGRFDGYRFTLQGAGNAWWFGHLQRLAPHIRPGARIRAGQLVGYSGSANGVPHLHLGVQSGNPLALLGLR